jgi:GAF domain
MSELLSLFTTFINLLGLAVSLGLGFYTVTRNPRSRLSWLAALTLWSLTGLFVYNALALNVPESQVLPWPRPIMLLALPFWFHLTLLLPGPVSEQGIEFFVPQMWLPGTVRRRLRTLAEPVGRTALPLAYFLALILLIGGVFPLRQLPGPTTRPVLFLSDRVPGPLFPLSIALLAVLWLLALLNLWQRRKQAPDRADRRRSAWLLLATAWGGLAGLYLSLGVWFGLAVPSFPGDGSVAAAAALLGYSVAEYHAAREGRAVGRDLLYITLAAGSLTAFCVLMAVLLHLGGHVFSVLTLIVIIIVAISSLMLYDGLRTTLDRLFYREQFRQLRANLRALAHEAGTGQSLPERLQAILGTLCRTLQIRRGLIALREGEGFVCRVTERAQPPGLPFPLPVLSAAEIVALPRPDTPSPEGMALLVPIHDGDDQIGALVLGVKETGKPYGEEDRMLLDDLAERLAAVIQATRLQEENACALNKMVADFREREHTLQCQVQQMLAEREEETGPMLASAGEGSFAALVEDALRQLHDYSYLGEHDLGRLQVVDLCLAGRDETFVTHIDRGKALSEVLLEALCKLRPEGEEPGLQVVPGREWEPFLILRDAYVRGEMNRDIMSRLYISEGTFNRTRRRAVRSVARALQEMEREAQRKETL